MLGTLTCLGNPERCLELYERAAINLQAPSGFRVEVCRYQGGGCQSHQLDPDHPLAEGFRLAQDETGQPRSTTSFTGGTDARYFARAGTPALVYGPGSLDQAHAPDEFVPVAELHLAQRQLTLAALSFLRR